MALPRSHPNILAGPYLERAAHWRKDEERLRAALADPATLFVPVWHARSAVVTSSDGRASAYFATGAQALLVLAPVRGSFEIRSSQHVGMRARQRHARDCISVVPRPFASTCTPDTSGDTG